MALNACVAEALPLSEQARGCLSSQIGESSVNPLPSHSELCEALGLPATPTPTQNLAAEDRLPARIMAGTVTLSECSLWKTCYESALHELLSTELVDALALHITTALQERPPPHGGLPVVLECGAGNGMLSFHLAERLGGIAKMVAIDDYSSKIETVREVRHEPVNDETLAKHSPTVVLASWMPSGVDFTTTMRACPSVQEIILVGEKDSGTCGDAWGTWGRCPPLGCRRCEFDMDGCERCYFGIEEDTPKPWENDGFIRQEPELLEAVSRWQLCRFDSTVATGFSTTVVFSRQ